MPYGEMAESRIKTAKSTKKRRREERREMCVGYVHQSRPFNSLKSSGPALVSGSLFTLEKSQG
jgi:hypothetical protein